MDREYKIALKEVNEILNLSEKNIQKKIPYKFRRFIVMNMEKEYIPKINLDISLKEQEISLKAKEMIAYIYEKFLKENVVL